MKFTLAKDSLSPSLKALKTELNKVPKQTYDYWVKVTPKDTGNARRNTTLNKDVINARYAYAERLDDGWSRQARNGMSKPTEKYFVALVKRIMKK